MRTLQKKQENYDYSLIKKKQVNVTGETGTLSVALASNLASKKTPNFFLTPKGSEEKYATLRNELRKRKDEQGENFNIRTVARELSLTENEARLLLLQSIDEAHLVDREGKTTYLTKRQQKLVYALSMFLSQSKDSPEVKAYVQALTEGRQPNSRITIPISITELTKLVTTDGKARARQKNDTLEDLRAMASIQQVQIYGEYGTDIGQVQFIASLISISEQAVDMTQDKGLDADFVSVTFGSIFFYELYNRFAIVKPTLFQIWGKAGSGTDTELFAMLLSDLLSKYSAHRIASIQAVRNLKKSNYKTEDSYFKARAKVQKDALTYSEYVSTLKERVTTDYESQRVYKATFYKHLDGAIKALQEYGLITEETHITLTNKGDRVDFVFNPDYVNQKETPSLMLPN